MSIIQTLSACQVADILTNDTNANWSYEGALTLAEHIDELSDDLGEHIELDIVSIRCEWSEYDADSLINDYGHLVDVNECTDKDDYIYNIVDELEHCTVVIGFFCEDEHKYLVREF